MRAFYLGPAPTFLGLASQSVKEGHVGEQTVLVLGVAQLREQLLHVVLGDLVTQVAEDVVELGEHHGAVAVLVVQLQQLEVVTVGALGVGGGHGGLHLLHHVVVLGELLALLVGLAEANTHLHQGMLLDIDRGKLELRNTFVLVPIIKILSMPPAVQ